MHQHQVAFSPAYANNPHPMPDRGLALSVRKLRKVFDAGVVAIDGITLEIAAGEFVAILGPSGCGKSTLLRLIAGLDGATSGSVVVGAGRDGDPVQAPRASGDQLDVAYVFQDAHLLPWRNVLQNVALPLELLGVDRSDRLARAAEVITQVGLRDAITRFPGQLSGGMRMRVSLARALITNPRLLLLDEPFAALDEITRQQLDDHLRRLWRSRGLTVLFVTHSTAEAVFLAQRAIVLSGRPGRVILDAAIDLPGERTSMLRGEPAFAAQTRKLYEALERGGA